MRERITNSREKILIKSINAMEEKRLGMFFLYAVNTKANRFFVNIFPICFCMSHKLLVNCNATDDSFFFVVFFYSLISKCKTVCIF